MFTKREEAQIDRVNKKHDEITSAIKSLSCSLSSLEQISKTKQDFIETNFDSLIYKLKNRKIALLDDIKKITLIKKKILIQQLNELRINQRDLNDFKIKHEQMILGESHGMDQNERRKYILSTTNKLLNSNCNTHSIINPLIKIENLNINQIFKDIENLGHINSCNIPLPPIVNIKEVYASSAKIEFADNNNNDDDNDDGKQQVDIDDIPKATEYKIETNKQENNDDNKWETAMIIDNGDKTCMLRGLLPNSSYLIRMSAWNVNGWSSSSKSIYIKTKAIKGGTRMIYLSPTPEYQNKLSILMTSYFTKWRGFHITMASRQKANSLSCSSTEIIHELSELGEKKSNAQLWNIPNGRWRVLGGKDLIVLGLDDDISIFKIASKFLESKGWTNVKKKNFHITLGLKKDLNREQIKEMAHILVDKEDPVKWEWVDVEETTQGKIIWHQRFPAYHL